MARPDLTELRTRQILDAFARCVGRAGLASTSLEDVAKEAGVKRSILRHYVGNRDELILALAERVVGRYHEELAILFTGLPDSERSKALVAQLLPSKSRESLESIVLFEGLIAASDKHPQIRELMRGYIAALKDGIRDQLRLDFPKASARECGEVAYGLVALCFNQESLLPLQLTPKYLRWSRGCALRLVGSLAKSR